MPLLLLNFHLDASAFCVYCVCILCVHPHIATQISCVFFLFVCWVVKVDSLVHTHTYYIYVCTYTHRAASMPCVDVATGGANDRTAQKHGAAVIRTHCVFVFATNFMFVYLRIYGGFRGWRACGVLGWIALSSSSKSCVRFIRLITKTHMRVPHEHAWHSGACMHTTFL